MRSNGKKILHTCVKKGPSWQLLCCGDDSDCTACILIIFYYFFFLGGQAIILSAAQVSQSFNEPGFKASFSNVPVIV